MYNAFLYKCQLFESVLLMGSELTSAVVLCFARVGCVVGCGNVGGTNFAISSYTNTVWMKQAHLDVSSSVIIIIMVDARSTVYYLHNAIIN